VAANTGLLGQTLLFSTKRQQLHSGINNWIADPFITIQTL
jgi:hypothetical protein